MLGFERDGMRLFSPFRPIHRTRSALAAVLAGLLLSSSSVAEEGRSKGVEVGPEVAISRGQDRAGSFDYWRQRVGALSGIRDPYQRLRSAALAAKAVEGAPSESVEAEQMTEQLDQLVKGVCGRLESYPQLQRVHGHEAPTWLSDRGDVTAQAVLALSALERRQSSATRRERLEMLANGLAALQRKDRQEFPFGAHLDWRDWKPLAKLDDGTTVPSTYFQTERAYAVQALAEASQVLNDEDLLLSAEREALGMSTHLVVAGRLVGSFSPQTEFASDSAAALPVAEGFWSLYQATGKSLYSDMAALATRWQGSASRLSDPSWRKLTDQLQGTASAPLLEARSVGKPNTFQVMEAEEGKVVNKAIETLGFRSPNGQAGKLATMGRENTFWMRFDVPTEDEYLFYLTYLQSDVGGGLVSVMMRIDGDKIFQVPLGDVDGLPILRRKFVDGPRPLRSGPHSFGIRFSGLLMTKPALLDSVIVQPAIERREFELPGGERLVLLHNVTGQEVGTDKAGFSSWPPTEAVVVNGDGLPAKLGAKEDRRRRKEFATLPPYGLALLKLPSAKLNLE